MKAYILMSGEYSDYHFEGVFSTKQKADDMVAFLKQGTANYGYDSLEVIEADMDVMRKENYYTWEGFWTDKHTDRYGGGHQEEEKYTIEKRINAHDDQGPIYVWPKTGVLFGMWEGKHAHQDYGQIRLRGYSEDGVKKALYDVVAKYKAAEAGI